jgi:hypothetical protein
MEGDLELDRMRPLREGEVTPGILWLSVDRFGPDSGPLDDFCARF